MLIVFSISEYLGSAEGQFLFSLALFSDSEMTTSLAEGSEISVGAPIYVRIHFTGPSSLQMIILSCMATPTANPDDATTKWYLANNGYELIIVLIFCACFCYCHAGGIYRLSSVICMVILKIHIIKILVHHTHS